MKKQSIIYVTPLILLALLHISSCDSLNTTEDACSKAKLYFEENATNLVLPNISGTPVTKFNQFDEINNNAYILWSNAQYTKTDSSFITEVPIVSLDRTLVTLNESHGGHMHTHKAICSNYLIIEEFGNRVKMNIATIIEKGTNHYIKYSSNKSNFSGFIFRSDLDGNILETHSYINGSKYKVNTKQYRKNELQNNSKFIGFSTAKLTLTKSNDEESETWYGHVICSICGFVYEADLLLNRGCKFCGEEVYNGYEACPKCQKPIIDCSCYEGPYEDEWNREDEYEGEQDGSRCEYCNKPIDSCMGHSAQTCPVCKMPVDVCKCN